MPAPPPTIETDLPCIKCGYNLRTLPSNGQCPECGEPIWRTRCTRPDFKAFRHFQMGLCFYSLAVLACFITSWNANANLPRTTNGADPLRIQMKVLLSRSAMVSLILVLVGLVWMVASPYPRRSRFAWAMIALGLLTTLFSAVCSF